MSTQPRASFAHYEILSPIGSGGMGEVFLARDLKLDRRVALKFLNERFSKEEELLNRFIQEAKAASALNHPNILTVYEIGEHDGAHYISAEFIDGKTLRERMRSRLTFDDTLSIMIQTAEALSAAHQAGIVHRDVKPENIMVRSDGYVKVLDFGLAKLTEINNTGDEDETKKLVKTNPGVVMGTVTYMSPEQARGKPTDARSDVFSFGSVLYEMLVGKVPFAGETVTDVLSSIISTEPQPITSLAPHLPRELQRIVQKTLKKKRDQRYQSTRDLLMDLKELRDELQIEAKLDQTAVPSTPEASRTSAPRHSTSSGGGIRDSILLTEFENTTGEAIFDQTLKMALAFSLAQSPFLDIVPDSKVSQTLRLMGRKPDEKVTKELGEEICMRQNLKAFLTGSITKFGEIYVLTLEAINARNNESLGREFEQVNSREDVLNALTRAATGLRERLGESLSSIEKFNVPGESITTSSLEALKIFVLGREQIVNGRQFEAIPFYKKALEIDPKFALAYTELAVVYRNTDQWKLAAEMTSKAFELRDSVSESEKLRITYYYHNFVQGELDKAIDTLELWRNTYPNFVVSYVSLSDSMERLGQSEKAVAFAREGIRIDPNYATIYMNLVESLVSLGRHDEAKETCRIAFERKLDGTYFHLFPLMIAFIDNDQAAIQKDLRWFAGRDDEHIAFDVQARAASVKGQWRTAQDFSRRSVDLATHTNAHEVAGKYAAEQAVRVVFWSSGTGLPAKDDATLRSVLKAQTNKALSLEKGQKVVLTVALALALAGRSDEAAVLLDELLADRPKDTLLKHLWAPTIKAALWLQAGKLKEVIEELEITERLEKAGEFVPQYLRGLALLRLNRDRDAAREFDKILDSRGEAPLSSLFPLAQLGKARALKNKTEYEKFFEMWKDADKDMPALVAAKSEFDALA
ncbi:MAG TPA: serine/threonine-protein kinase [Pyrinomonadaceae bacterium]|nr:serine/threonine-protein kinase [Pyrinomonadaceae bacterium]